MAQIVLDLNSPVADKFRKFIKLFGSEEIMFNKFIEFHIHRLKREIIRMEASLKKYEEKYHIESKDFYNDFNKGKYGDEKDFLIWSGVYEMYLDSKKKLEQLL